MPTVYPIEWVPPVVTGRYRNLQTRDVAVWERFLEKHGQEYLTVAYDVAIGGQEPEGEELTAEQRAGWKYTTAMKIDVLLNDGLGVVVVEVKPVASLTAIGGAIGYPLVLGREEPDLPIVGAGIVCEHLPLDIEWLAQQLNVRTWVV